MITLQELCRHLDNILQPELYSDFCTNGLQVEGNSNIVTMATAVSASLATIELAVQAGVQVLIVHHGLFWNRDSYQILGSKREKLRLLLAHNISLIAYHLPLDAHQLYGNNWKAAQDLGWKDLRPFGMSQRMAIGVAGDFEPMSSQQFLEQLEHYYGHTAHTALGGKAMVSSAALISGGAHKHIMDAAAEEIDCFVTGSFDEPVWHQAFEEKINFFALGHSNTEKIGPKALAAHLESHFGRPCRFLDIENPF